MHDEHCNCEHCWWSRDQKEICATCGCLVGAGCPEHKKFSRKLSKKDDRGVPSGGIEESPGSKEQSAWEIQGGATR